MVKFVSLFLVIGVTFLFGCTTAQKGAVAGGVIGGGLGAVIGNQSGHAGEGAAIGAATGAIAGGIIGEKMDTKFCPVCGKHFTSGVSYCPDDGTELKPIQK